MRLTKMILSFILSLFILFGNIINTAYADVLTVITYIENGEVDKDKTVEYNLRATYQCKTCDYQTDNYYDWQWHTSTTRPNVGNCSAGGSYIFSNKAFSQKNGDTLKCGMSDQNYYCIEILEPEVDKNNNHYQISYRVDNGPLQVVSTKRSDSEHPFVVIDKANTKSIVKFYYYLSEVPPTGVISSCLFSIIPFSLIGIALYTFIKRVSKK